MKELTKQAEHWNKVLRTELDETKRKLRSNEVKMEDMSLKLEETKIRLNNCKYCNCITVQ